MNASNLTVDLSGMRNFSMLPQQDIIVSTLFVDMQKGFLIMMSLMLAVGIIWGKVKAVLGHDFLDDLFTYLLLVFALECFMFALGSG